MYITKVFIFIIIFLCACSTMEKRSEVKTQNNFTTYSTTDDYKVWQLWFQGHGGQSK